MQAKNDSTKAASPSSGSLLRSTALAAAIAGAILVAVVMPAEYGVDPTGIGRVLGLTPMGKIKMSLAKESEAHRAEAAAAGAGSGEAYGPQPAPAQAADSAGRSDVTTLRLGPGEGKEIKLVMRGGARTSYSWTVEGGLVNFHTHGEPFDAPSDVYHSYGKGSDVQSDEGVLIAAVDGQHGWFWRNTGGAEVTVTLRTRGEYEEVRRPE